MSSALSPEKKYRIVKLIAMIPPMSSPVHAAQKEVPLNCIVWLENLPQSG
jgi:hypothetical protein